MESIQLKTSFDYSYLQALMSKELSHTRNILENHHYLRTMAKAAETALLSKSVNGCLECFLHLLRGGLSLGILLKYCEDSLSRDVVQDLKLTYETVAKTLMGDRRIFKFIHNSLIPLSNTFQASSGKMDMEQIDLEEDEREQSILLDEKYSASMVRREVFRTRELPSFNEYESGLHQMYLTADRLY